jgi:hypothetical protein
MASKAKYSQAPQEDPEDYTSAPPAYGAAAGSSSRDETQAMFGEPRSSDDNIPDDFKVRQTVSRDTSRPRATEETNPHVPDSSEAR